jgi:hypothetical protein
MNFIRQLGAQIIHRLQLQTNANSTLPALDTQRPATTRITFWARRQHCDPTAIQLPQRSTASLDFENWVAHKALVRLRGTRGGLGIVLSSLQSTFHFLRRACWCCCFSLFLWNTYFRTHIFKLFRTVVSQDCKHRASSSFSIVSASAKEGSQT